MRLVYPWFSARWALRDRARGEHARGAVGYACRDPVMAAFFLSGVGGDLTCADGRGAACSPDVIQARETGELEVEPPCDPVRARTHNRPRQIVLSAPAAIGDVRLQDLTLLASLASLLAVIYVALGWWALVYFERQAHLFSPPPGM